MRNAFVNMAVNNHIKKKIEFTEPMSLRMDMKGWIKDMPRRYYD